MDKNAILKLAKELISIPSVSSEKRRLDEALQLCRQVLAGVDCEDYSGDYPSAFFYNQKSTHYRFILNAHIDVVSAKEDSFEAIEKDGRLYGRGALDMKAAAAAEILVFKELVDKVDYPIGLQLVTDEEIGGREGTKRQIEEGLTADLVIVGEPTGLDLVTDSKGIIKFRIDLVGKNAHSAMPWEGKNVVRKLAKFVDKLGEKYPETDTEQWSTSVNFANIEMANHSHNQIPDSLRLYLDIRYTEGEDDKIRKRIEALLDEQDSYEVVMHESIQTTPRDNSDLTNLMKAVKQISPEKGRFTQSHYATDLRYFTEKGIPSVAIGPGGHGMHQDEEWVDLEELYKYADILHTFLANN